MYVYMKLGTNNKDKTHVKEVVIWSFPVDSFSSFPRLQIRILITRQGHRHIKFDAVEYRVKCKPYDQAW